VKKLGAKKKNVTLTVGSAKKIQPVFTPANASNKTLSYKSSNTKVVSVTAKGKMKAKAVGNAKITAKTTDGSKKSITIKVAVKAASDTQTPTDTNSGDDTSNDNTPADTTDTNNNNNSPSDDKPANQDTDKKDEDTDKKDDTSTAIYPGFITSPSVPSNPTRPETSVTVKNGAELLAAIQQSSNLPDRIIYTTSAEEKVEIPTVNLKNTVLEVDAANATVTNAGIFKSIKLKAIAAHTWIEKATGNTLDVSAKESHIMVDSRGSVNITAGSTVENMIIENAGVIQGIMVETTKPASSIVLTGSSIKAVPVTITEQAQNPSVISYLPVDVTASTRMTLQMRNGAEADSQITITNLDAIPVLQCNMLGGMQITVRRGSGAVSTTEIFAEEIPGEPFIPAEKGTVSGKLLTVTKSAIDSAQIEEVPVKNAVVYMIPYHLDIENLDLVTELDALQAAIDAAEAQNRCYYKTSDAEGKYNIELPYGNYAMIVKADGLQNYMKRVAVNAPAVDNGPITMAEFSEGKGHVSGIITDAATGQRVETPLHVYIRKGAGNINGVILKDIEITNGRYQFKDLTVGTYTIQVADERDVEGKYVGTSFSVTILENTEVTSDVVITPVIEGDQIRFILQWGSEDDGDIPGDLDSHLVGPTVDGTDKFHTYYSGRSYYEDDIKYTDLDVDDTDWEGPETTTIYKKTDGVYHFYIDNYSNRGEVDDTRLAKSKATVMVYLGTVRLATYYVPEGIGNVWDVCTFDTRTNSVTAVNKLIGFPYDESEIGLITLESLRADLLEKMEWYQTLANRVGGETQTGAAAKIAEIQQAIEGCEDWNVYNRYMKELQGYIDELTPSLEPEKVTLNGYEADFYCDYDYDEDDNRVYYMNIYGSAQTLSVIPEFTFASPRVTSEYEAVTGDSNYVGKLTVSSNVETRVYHIQYTQRVPSLRPEGVTVNGVKAEFYCGYDYDEDDNEYCYMNIYGSAETLTAQPEFTLSSPDLTQSYEVLTDNSEYVGKLTVTFNSENSCVYYVKYTKKIPSLAPEKITLPGAVVEDFYWDSDYDEDDNEYYYLLIEGTAADMPDNPEFTFASGEVSYRYETLPNDNTYVGKLTVTFDEENSRVYYVKYREYIY